MLPFELTKDTPYLALSGELWSVFYEYYNRNWLWYKGFLLYIPQILPLIPASGTTLLNWKWEEKNSDHTVPIMCILVWYIGRLNWGLNKMIGMHKSKWFISMTPCSVTWPQWVNTQKLGCQRISLWAQARRTIVICDTLLKSMLIYGPNWGKKIWQSNWRILQSKLIPRWNISPGYSLNTHKSNSDFSQTLTSTHREWVLPKLSTCVLALQTGHKHRHITHILTIGKGPIESFTRQLALRSNER